MLEPKKVKFRRHHRGNRRGVAKGGNYVAFGSYGLKAMESGWITSRQIEACRVSITRVVRKVGKMWIRIFPDKPITKKPAETRQGKGKGPVDHWVAVIKPGHVLFEIAGCSLSLAREALGLADAKLPFRCRLITRAQTF